MAGMPSLQEMVQREIARRTTPTITIRRIIVKPIYENDQRIGSRVWDEDGVELEEHDPRFRVAVCGRMAGRAEPSKVDDEAARGISGGAVIFRRVVGTSPLALKIHRDDFMADDDVVEGAAARIAALRSREAS